MQSRRQALTWMLLLDAGLLIVSGLLYARGTHVQSLSLLAATGIFVVWQIGLIIRDVRRGTFLGVQKHVVRAHWVQAFTQGSVYLYWSIYWPEVRHYALFIVAQLLFAYSIEGLLAWTRNRRARLGFGPFPIIFSINLFFWFLPQYAYLQLLLVAGAYLTGDFVTWKRDGREIHIFNPSAIAIAITGFILMFTGAIYLPYGIKLAYGVDVIMALYIPPNFFEVLFLLGLVPQLLFSTTLITGGAALALTIVYIGFKLAGVPQQTPFDVSVFIGLNLLVTDPATSPHTRPGKLLFGMSYGFGIFIAYVLLRYTQQPSFFDKILPVLAVNLLVRQFDTAGMWLVNQFSRLTPQNKFGRVLGSNYTHLFCYFCLFMSILPWLKVRDPGAVDPFPPQLLGASPPVQELLAQAIAMDIAHQVRQPWGFRQEYLFFDDNYELEKNTAEADLRMGSALLVLGQQEMAKERMERSIMKNPSYVTQVNNVIAGQKARWIPR